MNSLPIELRKQTDTLTTWIHRGTSDKLVVCFSGIGSVPDETPPYEFARTATQDGLHNVLFVTDPHRTWLNGPGLLEEICEEVEVFRNECNAVKTIAAGHSMGGFSALVLPEFTKVDAVLAFAPQLSVDPEIVPDEKRWMIYRDKIETFKIKSAADYLNAETAYVVIHGRHGREAPQRDRFPRPKNLRHFVMPHTVHNVPQRLKRFGILDRTFDLTIHGRPRKLRLLLENSVGAVLQPQQN